MTMYRKRTIPALLGLALTACGALFSPVGLEAVPLTFQYQGHVIVSGVAFEGTGQFKFALLDGAGNGLWRNTGMPGQPTEPPMAVSLPMRRGVYQVSLGDTNLPNMAPLSAQVFAGDALNLRVWFNDGTNGFQQLAPDTRISSVAFAVRAATVDRVEETALPPSVARLVALTEKMTFSSTNPNDTNLLASGFSVFRELPAAAWENGPDGAPAARSDHTGVWTGREFIIWGGAAGGSSLLASGAKYDSLTGSWEVISTIDAPVARRRHEAVWTGMKMIVWGGHDGTGWNPVGGQYDPRIQRWFPVPQSPLLAREDHIMLWTGTRVAIWGGRHAVGRLGDGALFDPNSNQWTPIPPQGAPVARSTASGVWTGAELIVWGGRTTLTEVGDGARLGITNGMPTMWKPISRMAAPSPRQAHTAVWTGTRMLVWGGISGTDLLADGKSYDPVADQWSPITGLNAPSGRTGHSAVWTGKEMLILGGVDEDGETASAHAYDPGLDQWRALPSAGGPVARAGATAVWTGRDVLIFGGEASGAPVGALQSIDPEPPVYLYRKP